MGVERGFGGEVECVGVDKNIVVVVISTVPFLAVFILSLHGLLRPLSIWTRQKRLVKSVVACTRCEAYESSIIKSDGLAVQVVEFNERLQRCLPRQTTGGDG
jgi:hypothetical protein